MLTQARLQALLTYDPVTGVFRWIAPTKGRRIKGNVAGTKNDKGYIIIEIDDRRYKASRLAWLYLYGVWPEGEVDHTNRDKGDNSQENLADVTHQQNAENGKLRVNNTTGIPCVYLRKNGRYWAAVKGKSLGVYATKLEASEAVGRYRNGPHH